jgi:L-fucose mutarotase
MLKGIDPLLNGELLRHLDQLGHGESMALVDRNFPAYGVGVPVVDLGEVSVERVTRAVMTVFPVDQFDELPIARMGIDGDLETQNQAHRSVLAEINRSEGTKRAWRVIPRADFYSEVKRVRFIIRCLDSAPYACFIFQKGVV